MADYEWDDNEWPLAYLITFRTYGTWLHGDDRLSVDLHGRNVYGTPKVRPRKEFVEVMAGNMTAKPFLLDARNRSLVDSAIREVCSVRSYRLSAMNVRTNHIHVVVSAEVKPERLATAFKSYSTRKMRQAQTIPEDLRPWSRGESTRYLWKPRFVELAVDYVVDGQKDELPDFQG